MVYNDDKTVEEIINSIECSKDFACSKNGFQNVLKSTCFAGRFFTCTGSNSYLCPYLLPFGYSHFCTCPLFLHIAQKNTAAAKTLAKAGCSTGGYNLQVSVSTSTVD
jgi:tRNA(Phe) wybutosine-synthesizing methylase Tyw3